MPRASTAAASSPDRGYQLRLDEGVAPMSNSTPTRPEYGNRRATDRTSSGYRYWKKNPTDLALISYGKIKTLLTKVFLTGGCEINSLISCVNSRHLKGFFFDVTSISGCFNVVYVVLYSKIVFWWEFVVLIFEFRIILYSKVRKNSLVPNSLSRIC